MSGSTVPALYGAGLEPNDLDVVPDLEPANLGRLARLLIDVEAIPAYVPEWANGPSLDECRAWRPEPATAEQLDHLFVTTLGMIDIPPSITGTYERLTAGGTTLIIAGVDVLVCHPTEVLDRLPAKQRAKDIARAEIYTDLRHRLATDPTLRPRDITAG